MNKKLLAELLENMTRPTGLVIGALLLALVSPSLHAQPAPSLFAARSRPFYTDPPIMTRGIHVVGNSLCYSDSPEDAQPPLQELPGQWVALVHRETGWFLELATAKSSLGTVEASSEGARFVLQRLPELKLGPIRAATIVSNADEQIVTFDDRSWRMTQVNRRLVLEHQNKRWWVEPRTFEEIDAPLSPGARGECLTTTRGGPTCPDWAYRYGIVWAGDLDGDGELDFIFEWSSTEVFGLTLGLSRDPPPGAMLRLVAGLDWGCS